jgi:predicted ATPase
MRNDLPTGTVTFLFTDVEGSTKLLHSLGADGYADALAEHRRFIRAACAAGGGVEVDTQGDAFFMAFPTAPRALAAASAFTESLASGPISVRVGLHTGTPLLTDEGYVGADVHRAARIAAAGHGGQVLVSATTATLVSGDDLRDLGEHRLKDLAAAERIYQLGELDFPPLKTLYRTNLPVPATPFLGRERELSEVVELLTNRTRLLTLTGPGGTGKTRLALQAAAEASEFFPDGLYWVPLAPLRDPELVLPSLARVLAVGEEPGTPLEDTLVAHLSGRSLLVLLDNVEHLLPPAAERVAALRATNGSCLLVTSRERLRIGGEQTWPVPPLAEDDGAELFLARALAVDPAFTTTPSVDELCARLDELPLAIELAAARTAVFSAEQLLERLAQRLDLLKGDRDTDPRQQTLRATIAWSYDLLSAEEQRLFARFAAFVGGCTYDAAEEVAGADPDVLQSLLDKSLVRKRDSLVGPRYWMLETIREYAAERLEALGEADELRRRHAEYFVSLAEEAEPHLRRDDVDWVRRLDEDRDNLRTTFEVLEASGESQWTMELAVAAARYWYLTGQWPEGRRRIEAALSADDTPTATRAKALNEAAAMATLNGDYAGARDRAEKSLALSELHDESGMAYARFMLGFAAVEAGDFEVAVEPLEESLRSFEDLGDEHYWGIVAFNLAWALDEVGERERARTLHEEVLRRARAAGETRTIVFHSEMLAYALRREGNITEAFALLKESLPMSRALRDPVVLGDQLRAFASAYAPGVHAELAVRLLAFGMKQYEELVYLPAYVVKNRDETLEAARTRLDDAAVDRAWEQGRRLTVDEAVALALAHAS